MPLYDTSWSTELSEKPIVLEGTTSSLARSAIVSEQFILWYVDVPTSLALPIRSYTKLPSNASTPLVVTNSLREPGSI